jgi:hypothetical protein
MDHEVSAMDAPLVSLLSAWRASAIGYLLHLPSDTFAPKLFRTSTPGSRLPPGVPPFLAPDEQGLLITPVRNHPEVEGVWQVHGWHFCPTLPTVYASILHQAHGWLQAGEAQGQAALLLGWAEQENLQLPASLKSLLHLNAAQHALGQIATRRTESAELQRAATRHLTRLAQELQGGADPKGDPNE